MDSIRVFNSKSSRVLKKRVNEFLTEHPSAKSFLAGSMSGTCSTLLFQPFDLLKTRIQSASIIGAANIRMMPIVVQVIQNDSVTGLWRGTVPSLMRCVPGVGLYFSSLNYIHVKLYKGSVKATSPSAIEAVCIGVGARSFAGAVLLPATVLKARYESGLFGYKSVSQALTLTYTKEGLRGLFTGLTPTLLRDAPYSGLYFMFYSQLKTLVIPKSSSPSSSSSKPVAIFGCGLSAGLLASLVTHPFDVIKTKMQLHPHQHPNLYTTISLTFKKQRLNGFFVGLMPRIIRRTMMSALAWTIYESFMKNVGVK